MYTNKLVSTLGTRKLGTSILDKVYKNKLSTHKRDGTLGTRKLGARILRG